MSSPHSKAKKYFLLTLVGYVFAIHVMVLGGVFFFPQTAYAQPPQAVIITEDVPRKTESILGEIEERAEKAKASAFLVAVVNAFKFLVQKFAYDAAVFIASGGQGQGPLFEHKNFGAYLKDSFGDAAGEALGSFSQASGIENFFNLCSPSNPQIKLQIGLGIIQRVTPPRPKCDWNNVSRNWSEFAKTYRNDPARFFSQVGVQFQPSQSPLSVALQVQGRTFQFAAEEREAAREARREGQGYKAVKEPVSGQIKTPSPLVKSYFEEEVVKKPAQSPNDLLLASVGAAEYWETVGNTFLQAFVSTLADKLLFERIRSGFFSVGDLVKKKADRPELATVGGRIEAEAVFASLLTPSIAESGTYDVVSEFAACPSGEVQRQPNSCVIDSSLGAAIGRGSGALPLTVRQALDQGLLHGDWPLIPPDDRAKNQDPFCFSYGYCYSNLVKLRLARILPIGWELAAKKSPLTDPVKLATAVNGFYQCNAAGKAGPVGSGTEWCHLIDPNWIIKYPITQCRAKVFGPTLLSGQADARAQTCVDSPSCIAEDGKGSCVGGYGYCTREKNIWHLGGESCSPSYASCATLTRAGTSSKVSVLTNTADFKGCTVENAGCKWYATAPDPETPGAFAATPRVYLDGDAEACTQADVGCTDFVRVGVGSTRNYVLNGSFETDSAPGDNIPDEWEEIGVGGGLTYATDGSASSQGSDAVSLSRQRQLRQNIVLTDGGTYTVSLAVRREADRPGNGQLFLNFLGGVDVSRIPTTCAVDAPTSRLILNVNDATNSYRTYHCSFTLEEGRKEIHLYVQSLSDGFPLWFDAVQLESGSVATPYREAGAGYDTGAQHAYLKVAPPSLGCRGNVSDPATCSQYAQVCSASEVGCQGYKPTSGDPEVAGVVGPQDSCPASCVGYETYREEPTAFQDARFPEYLIPRTARACSGDQVGCDEFTNVATEAKESYIAIRACEKPTEGVPPPTYYTWEGSGATGFQLRVWRLKRGADGAPGDAFGNPLPDCEASYAKIPGEAGYDPVLSPDCREFYDAAGIIFYRPYSRTVTITDDCRELRRTIASVSEDECRAHNGTPQLPANADGTVSCLFKTFPGESRSCSSLAVGCRAYVGQAGRNVRNLITDSFEGDAGGWIGGAISSESLINGGHSYASRALIQKSVTITKGSTYFLSFMAKGHGKIDAGFAAGPPEAGNPFRPSQFSYARDNPATPGIETGIELGTEWQLYNLGPVTVTWDISPPDRVVAADLLRFRGFLPGTDSFVDNITLREVATSVSLIRDSWRTPAECDATNNGLPAPQAQLGCTEYRSRAGEVANLKSFSKLCRQGAVGCASLIDTKNSDASGVQTWNLRCNLAAPPGVGGADCNAFGEVACHVSEGATSCAFRFDGDLPTPLPAGVTRAPDTVTVPADMSAYLVLDSAKSCSPAKTGCSELGEPKRGVCRIAAACAGTSCNCTLGGAAGFVACQVASGQTSCSFDYSYSVPAPLLPTEIEYGKTYLRNNPNAYQETLCKQEEAGCSAWDREPPPGGDEGIIYFKDFGGVQCEFRENIAYGRETVSGWFRKGTIDPVPCYPAARDGATYSILRNADPGFTGAAGICPVAQNGCTEFRDPQDKAGGTEPTGTPYYLIKNQSIDTRSCGGQVSQAQGCVVFTDTGTPTRTISSEAANEASEAQGGAKVTPPEGICVAPFGIECNREPKKPDGTCDNAIRGLPGTAKTCNRASDCSAGFECQASKDGNTILKVTRDRACGAWVSCKSSTPVFDQQTGRYREICDNLGLCTEYRRVGGTVQCVRWEITPPGTPLHEEAYVGRNISFAGQDYSGLSIPDQQPTHLLKQVSVGTHCSIDNAICSKDSDCRDFGVEKQTCVRAYRLAYAAPSRLPDGSQACGPGVANGADCSVAIGTDESGRAIIDPRGGKCWDGQCLQTPEGLPLINQIIVDQAVGVASCRAYPEQNSPFPNKVVTDWQGDVAKKIKPGFQGATLCAEGEDCECSYQKTGYGTAGGVTKYVGLDTPDGDIAEGICQGGDFDGYTCEPTARRSAVRTPPALLNCIASLGDTEAERNGACFPLKRQDQVFGLLGQCLQRDTAVNLNGGTNEPACLAWLPVDRIPGAPDIYNRVVQATFSIADQYYCAVGEVAREIHTYGRRYCSQGCSFSRTFEGREMKMTSGCVEAGSALVHPRIDCKGRGEDGAFALVTRKKYDCAEGAQNDYRYICIPPRAVHVFDPEQRPCQKDDLSNTDFYSWIDGYRDARMDPTPVSFTLDGAPIYQLFFPADDDNEEHFAKYFKPFVDCATPLIPLSDTRLEYHKVQGHNYQFVCTELAQVAVQAQAFGGDGNKAWTNRVGAVGDGTVPLLESPVPYTIADAPRALQYVHNTTPPPGPSTVENPFGIARPNDIDYIMPISSCVTRADISLPAAPEGVPACSEGSILTGENQTRPYLDVRGQPNWYFERGAVCTPPPPLGDPFLANQSCNPGISCNLAESPACYAPCAVDADCGGGGNTCDEEAEFCRLPNGMTTLAQCQHAGGAGVTGRFEADCAGVERRCSATVRAGDIPLARQRADASCFIRACEPDAVGAGGHCSLNDPLPDSPTDGRYLTVYEGGGTRIDDAARGRSLSRIHQLFAKVYAWLTWTPGAGRGAGQYTTAPSAPRDISAQGAPPTVKSVGACNPNGTCAEGGDGSITVNGASSGRVVGSGGSLPITVKFYAFAQDNQLPLRYAAVDWDADGTSLNIVGRDTPGLYRNHRGTTVAGVTQCDGGSFGRIKGETCDDTAPFTYNHVYSCSSDARLLAARGELRTCGTVQPGGATVAAELDSNCWSASDQACQFRPRVQVKDNWGFCNGVCPLGGAGDSCYADGRADECFPLTGGAWTSFGGRVLVRP